MMSQSIASARVKLGIVLMPEVAELHDRHRSASQEILPEV